MTSSDFDGFSGLIGGIAELYSHKLSDMQVALWFNAVSAYSLDQVQGALLRHTRDAENGRFMPKPADVVRAIDGMPGDRAESSWAKIYRAMCSVGCGQSVLLEDGIAAQVLRDMGGWIKFGRTLEREMPFYQKEFCRRYTALLNTGDTFEPTKLEGEYELDNRGRGYPVQPPIRITAGTIGAKQLQAAPKNTAQIEADPHDGN